MKSTQAETQEWYKAYYQKRGNDRNDLLTNPEVLFQHLAVEASVVSALRRAETLDRAAARILDVGCGSGGSLTQFLQLGFLPDQLVGIDVLQDRIDDGKKKYPNLDLVCDDAAAMPFESGTFDLVFESTMFIQLTNEGLAQAISGEMLRVTKPSGYLMLVDWRYGKPGNREYLAVSRKRINRLFSVGSQSDVVYRAPGALVPPIGRFFSAHLPSAYFMLRAVLPFLVGSTTTLLRRRAP